MSKANSIQENKRNLIEYLAIALISLTVQVSVLGLLSLSISGLAVGTLEGAVFFVLILGLANSFLIPPLVSFSVRFHPLLFPRARLPHERTTGLAYRFPDSRSRHLVIGGGH